MQPKNLISHFCFYVTCDMEFKFMTLVKYKDANNINI